MSNRCDPIRENYYKSLENVELAISLVFYLNVILSFAPFFIDKDKYHYLVNILIICFCLTVMIYACLSVFSRLFLFPRAEKARRKEFLSSAMGVELIHERTNLYYNNNEKESFRRLGMMLCEDAFFTMKILQKMAIGTRWKTGVYFLIWVIILLTIEKVSLDIISVATIVVFSEEIISRYLRLEWQRMSVEDIYEDTRKTLQSKPAKAKYKAYVIDGFVSYESAKAVGGILLSVKMFEQMNQRLTEEWERIKVGL